MGQNKSALINELKEFKKRNRIERMYLFGSRATGKTRRWSDVDLLVVSKRFRGKGLLDRSPKLYLKWKLNYPVDFLCYTPEEFAEEAKRITIVRKAVKQGVEIP